MAKIFRAGSRKNLGFSRGGRNGIFMTVSSRGLLTKMAKIAASNRANLLPAIRKAVLITEAEAKRLIKEGYFRPAIDTGRLIQSIQGVVVYATGTKALGRVGTNVYYSIYVHEGTRYMEARPFLVDAVKNMEPRIKEIFLEAVNKSFK